MKRILLFIIFCLIIVSPAWSTTYYLRADGTVTAANKATATGCGSAATAMNIKQHNAAAFSAGDVITLCDTGGVFRGQFTIPSSGSAGKVINYKVSGSPIINGADLLTDWIPASPPIHSKSAITSDPVHVFQDGARLIRSASYNAMAAGSWFRDSGTNILYVWCTDSANPSTHILEAPITNYWGISGNGKSYLEFDDLNVTNARTSAYSFDQVDGSHDVTLNRCTSSYSVRGLSLPGYSAFTTSNIVCNDCIAHDHLGEGFWFGRSTNSGCNRCTVFNGGTDIVTKGYTAGSPGDGGGILIGIGCINCFVKKSHIYSIDYSFSFSIENQGTSYPQPTGSTVEGNLIEDSTTNGIPLVWLTGASDVFEYNILRSRNLQAGIKIGAASPIDTTTNEHIYNNTIYVTGTNSSWGIYAVNATGTIIKNNIIYTASNVAQLGVWSDAQTGLVSDYNDYYGNIRFFYQGGSPEYPTTLSSWRTVSSRDTHSINANPLFINISAGDFHLQPTSPAISSGTNVGLTQDYDGMLVPSTPDIGAYEFLKNARPSPPQLSY